MCQERRFESNPDGDVPGNANRALRFQQRARTGSVYNDVLTSVCEYHLHGTKVHHPNKGNSQQGKTLHILNRELVLELTKTHRIHLTNPGKVYHTSKNDFYTRSDMNKKAVKEVLICRMSNSPPRLVAAENRRINTSVNIIVT